MNHWTFQHYILYDKLIAPSARSAVQHNVNLETAFVASAYNFWEKLVTGKTELPSHYGKLFDTFS